MNILELLSGIKIALTNEEQKFLDQYGHRVHVIALNGRDEVVARNLVKKGVYNWSPNRKMLINPKHEKI